VQDVRVSKIQNPMTEIETHITAVTVYIDRALVTRQGIINLIGDERQLVMTELPVTLDPESVRVSGKGAVAVKLQGISTDRHYTSEPVGERIAQLTAEIESLESQQRRVQLQLETLNLQSDFIQGLQSKTETSFARNLAQQRVSLDDILRSIDFMSSKSSEYANAKEDLRDRSRQLDKQLQALRAQLKQVKTPQSQESFQLRIAIEPSCAGEFQLEVKYIVDRASWTPLYDLRVQSTSKTIQLNYLAQVTQTTGEDWENVHLTLSTAKTGLGTLPPKLDPWYINIPAPAPGAMMMRSRAKIQSDTPTGWMEQETERGISEEAMYVSAAAPAPAYIAETVVAQISQQGSVVKFEIGGGGNIPSDGNPHKATIFSDDFPCKFNYIAMPRLVSFAYLEAQAKNPDNGATLLPGVANIFRDDMFVGTTNLENIAPGQEFKLNLGIDEGIKIDRDLVERQVDKKFLGGNRLINYGYRITITNLLAQPTHLDLSEQIPHSQSEQIKVKLTKITPQISLGELGLLTWHLDLAPNRKMEIYYQFAIEHSQQTQIIGLDI
jgi:uncharacterized protein (TIGR02231 family)